MSEILARDVYPQGLGDGPLAHLARLLVWLRLVTVVALVAVHAAQVHYLAAVDLTWLLCVPRSGTGDAFKRVHQHMLLLQVRRKRVDPAWSRLEPLQHRLLALSQLRMHVLK